MQALLQRNDGLTLVTLRTCDLVNRSLSPSPARAIVPAVGIVKSIARRAATQISSRTSTPSEAAGSRRPPEPTCLLNADRSQYNQPRSASSRKDERSGATKQHCAADHTSRVGGRTVRTARVLRERAERGLPRPGATTRDGAPARPAHGRGPAESVTKASETAQKIETVACIRVEPEVNVMLACPATPPSSGRHVRPSRSWRPRPPQQEIQLEPGVSIITIFIVVVWLNLVTVIIAACRVAAHADVIELEMLVQVGRGVGRHSEANRGESSLYHAHVVGRGHQSTLRRIS